MFLVFRAFYSWFFFLLARCSAVFFFCFASLSFFFMCRPFRPILVVSQTFYAHSRLHFGCSLLCKTCSHFECRCCCRRCWRWGCIGFNKSHFFHVLLNIHFFLLFCIHFFYYYLDAGAMFMCNHYVALLHFFFARFSRLRAHILPNVSESIRIVYV